MSDENTSIDSDDKPQRKHRNDLSDPDVHNGGDEPSRDHEDLAPWRERLHEVIFEADTLPGKIFDWALLLAILISTVAVMLETVAEFSDYKSTFLGVEWAFTILFTIEYLLRLTCVRRPMKYATSFFGLIDLISILPTYLSLLIPGAQAILVIRALRLLRIFRILKAARFLHEAAELRQALWASRDKIIVFLFTVVTAVSIMGAAMYLVESPYNDGFRDIPQSMYWAIVTMTTVGYGDITPATTFGKFLASLIILFGYAMIVVPTGFVSAEFIEAKRRPITTQACPDCMKHGHDVDASFCKFCGGKL